MGKTDADARAVQPGRELVGDRERGCPECTMLMKLGEYLNCHIRPRELVGVVLDLLTTKQRFEPTDTPLQLTDRGACVDRGNENVDNHDALETAHPLDRLGNMGGSRDGSLRGGGRGVAGAPGGT